jgi:hypothetical protein
MCSSSRVLPLPPNGEVLPLDVSADSAVRGRPLDQGHHLAATGEVNPQPAIPRPVRYLNRARSLTPPPPGGVGRSGADVARGRGNPQPAWMVAPPPSHGPTGTLRAAAGRRRRTQATATARSVSPEAADAVLLGDRRGDGRAGRRRWTSRTRGARRSPVPCAPARRPVRAMLGVVNVFGDGTVQVVPEHQVPDRDW